MSFSSLPQELVDHLALLVGVGEQGRDKVRNVKNLVNFCLVSMQTVSSARAALYRRPFAWPNSSPDSYTFGVGHHKADTLLSALEGNGFALGRLVRGTSGIDDWLDSTGDDARIRRWYHAVLRACPNLQQINLHFTTPTELSDVLRIIAIPDHPNSQNSASQPTLSSTAPLSRLQCLDFNDRRWKRQGNQVHIPDVFSTFGRFKFSALDTVKFAHVFPSSEPSVFSSIFPFPIKHFHIKTIKNHLAESIALSSRLLSDLETFSLDCIAIEGSVDLAPFTTTHGAHLQKLTINFNAFHEHDYTVLSEYASWLPDIRVAPGSFQYYPLLTALTLNNTHGPSLLFLSTLAKSSPLLRTLDLTDSRWISDSDPLSNVPDEIFPEIQILSSLDKFNHLNNVHLGTLPTMDEEGFETFVSTLESRGVKVRFDCCV